MGIDPVGQIPPITGKKPRTNNDSNDNNNKFLADLSPTSAAKKKQPVTLKKTSQSLILGVGSNTLRMDRCMYKCAQRYGWGLGSGRAVWECMVGG